MGYVFNVVCPNCGRDIETKKIENIQCGGCGKRFSLPDDFCLCCTYSLTGTHCDNCHKKFGWAIKKVKDGKHPDSEAK